MSIAEEEEVTAEVIVKRDGSRPDTVYVTFLFPVTIMARQVHVVGDFNDWNRASHPMTKDGRQAEWQLEVELLRGKAYQFRYLLDGKVWQNDWDADRYLPNPFGGENSVVQT
jgi:1,4-alpha-glucan branching enzyme